MLGFVQGILHKRQGLMGEIMTSKGILLCFLSDSRIRLQIFVFFSDDDDDDYGY